jgi:hypothetical protein
MRTVPGKLLHWTSREWREICAAYGYLLLAWWRLSVRRERLDRWIFQDAQPPCTSSLPNEADRRSIIRSAGWINAAARYPRPWARCLQRSLALCLLLERRGFNTQLKIGVRKSGGDLKAHAWVEYCGKVLNDSQDIARNFTLMNKNNEMPSIQQLSRAIRGKR